MTDPVDAALDTSDWKTYRNEEYGFEFKLSDEYSIPENEKNTIREQGGANILDPKKTEYLFNSRKGLEEVRRVAGLGDAVDGYRIKVKIHPYSLLAHNNFEDWIRRNTSTSYLTIGKNSLRNSNEVIFVSWNSICDDYSAFFLRREYLLELNTCASLYFSGVTNFKDDYFSTILNSVQF